MTEGSNINKTAPDVEQIVASMERGGLNNEAEVSKAKGKVKSLVVVLFVIGIRHSVIFFFLGIVK